MERRLCSPECPISQHPADVRFTPESGHSVSKISAAIATRADESDSSSVENERLSAALSMF
jgi:hypothetical protein